MKKFKHRKTGEIATYQDGVLKSSGFCVEIGIEPSSEFWEEVIEKDYEILVYYCQNQIKSVKRLSDSEIFTIGDKITDGDLGTCSIRGFKIENNKMHVIYLDYDYPLEKTVKYKQPLFTTEDGVDIYKGDEIFIVNKFFTIGFSKGVEYNNHKDNKFFSTKEAAQEYIILNKPCLSINDVQKCLNKTDVDLDSEHELNYQLKKLVKSKL
jgi:hypothetical protein